MSFEIGISTEECDRRHETDNPMPFWVEALSDLHSPAVSSMAAVRSGGLYAHSASYAISKYRPTPHGLGCAVPLPYTMAFNLPVSVPALARIASALGEQIWMHSLLDAARLAVHSVARLLRDTGLPATLQELGGIEKSDLTGMADLMIKKWPRPMNPRSMTIDDSLTLWRNLWEGIL